MVCNKPTILVFALFLAISSWEVCARRPSVSAHLSSFNKPSLEDIDPQLAYSPTAEVLNIHVVAHTHDDVGWLKTVDEYFYGANMSIQNNAGVQYTIDEVIPALVANPARKFIYVEIAFFMRWWRQQTHEMQTTVRDLVREGRFEFINGGWCMNDEATTLFEDVVDQMSLGHQFLAENFGIVPRIGWHIDPFGHSSQQAALFARMGFDAFFFARIDYQDMALRTKEQRMELVWRGSQSLGQTSDMFTSVLTNGYCPPGGFVFEWGDEPVKDDPRLEGLNVKQLSDQFVASAKQRAQNYRTNHVLVPFGCDFMFMNAQMMFKNMDKLIAYITANAEAYGVNIFYSTPSIYVDAVNKLNLTWELKTDDFFPYADGPQAFWTGYFDSRVALKGYVRTRNALLHAAESLFTQWQIAHEDKAPDAKLYEDLVTLREALGVAQHHDAVSGTEMQHVANDYAKQLSIGSAAVSEVFTSVLGNLTGLSVLALCPLANESVCPATATLAPAGKLLPVVLYNPLAWNVVESVRIPVPINGVTVQDSSKAAVPSQVIPVTDLYKGNSPYEVVFTANLPALGYATYFLNPAASAATLTHPQAVAVDDAITIDNQYITVTLDSTGSLVSILNKALNTTLAVTQEYGYYPAFPGTQNDGQASGAYIFRPAQNTTIAYTTTSPTVTVVRGPVVTEVQRVWPEVTQKIRVYNTSGPSDRFVEVEHTMQPIPVADGIGKEVITRYATPLNTAQTWYTDAQGIEFQERRYNFRPSWNLTVTSPVAGNYYPMNMGAYIKDAAAKTQLTVLSDRSRSAASLANGALETMLYRRLLHDDGRGVGEPLNETYVVRMTEYLLFDSIAQSPAGYRTKSKYIAHPPVAVFGTVQGEAPAVHASGSVATLPANIQLLTFNTYADVVLLRLHNIFQVGENGANTTSVDLNQLVSGYEVSGVVETTLGSTLRAQDLHRLHWITQTEGDKHVLVDDGAEQRDFTEVRFRQGQAVPVTIAPTDIKTFLVKFVKTAAPAFAPAPSTVRIN